DQAPQTCPRQAVSPDANAQLRSAGYLRLDAANSANDIHGVTGSGARQQVAPLQTAAGHLLPRPRRYRHTGKARRLRVRFCAALRCLAPLAMMDAQITKVAELLHEAAETHHLVYRIVDGADDDWASWYGDWLVRLSELPQLLGKPPVRSELVYLLVRLDKEYIERKPPEAWETYYARGILQHFSSTAQEGG